MAKSGIRTLRNLFINYPLHRQDSWNWDATERFLRPMWTIASAMKSVKVRLPMSPRRQLVTFRPEVHSLDALTQVFVSG